MYTRPILIAFTALALASCVPEHFDYYAPQAPSGVLGPTHGECNDVKDAIVFTDPDNSDVTIRFHVGGPIKPGSALYLIVSIEKSSVQVPTDWLESREKWAARVRAAHEQDARPFPVRFSDGHITVVSATGERTALKLDFPGGDPTGFDLGAGWYYRYLKFARPPGDYFELEIPEIDLNGTKLPLLRIRFTPASIGTMTGINC